MLESLKRANEMFAVQQAAFVAYKQGVATPAQQENNTMTDHYSERNAANRMLRDARHAWDHKDQHDHHIAVEPITSIEDFVERHAAGKLTITPKEDRDPWAHWTEHFSARDPAKPADHKGYEARKAERDKEYTAVRGKVDMLTPSEFEPAVQEYFKKAPTHTVH